MDSVHSSYIRNVAIYPAIGIVCTAAVIVVILNTIS